MSYHITHDHHPGITLTRHQLEAWAGRTLTDDEVGRLCDAIPNSSIPDAVAEIGFALAGDMLPLEV